MILPRSFTLLQSKRGHVTPFLVNQELLEKLQFNEKSPEMSVYLLPLFTCSVHWSCPQPSQQQEVVPHHLQPWVRTETFSLPVELEALPTQDLIHSMWNGWILMNLAYRPR